jgi:hypothetical protein
MLHEHEKNGEEQYMVVIEQSRSQTAIEFDGVVEGYRHYQKRITPSLDFQTPAVHLKWYDIAFTVAPIAPELNSEARSFLLSETESGRFTANQELGFVLLHDCGDVVFLLVSTWRNSNELWETVYLKQADNGIGFEPLHHSDQHKPSFCVWEMGAVAHEAQAWSRYLASNRDHDARETYFFDMYAGVI